MAQVRIMLMPNEMCNSFVFVGKDKAPLIKSALPQFLVLPPMDVYDSEDGADLAGEIFNLTNDPSRQDERLERYGNGRSLSPGDVVRTPQGDFLCCSFGWEKL